MTKPSNFTMNSDYLSLAQKDNYDYTIIFPQEYFPGGYSYNRTQDIKVPSIKGAIDEIMISRNGGDYLLGNALVIESNSPGLSFYVYRPSPDTIRVRLWTMNSDPNGWTMPTQTLKIRISSFLPPNVF